MCQSGDLNQELEDLLVRVDFRLKVKTSVLTLQISEIQSQARKKCIEPNFILEGRVLQYGRSIRGSYVMFVEGMDEARNRYIK